MDRTTKKTKEAIETTEAKNTKNTKDALKALVTTKGILFDYTLLEKMGIRKKLQTLLSFSKRMQQGRKVIYKKASFYNVLELPKKKLFAVARSAYHHNYRKIKDVLGNVQLIDKLPKGDKIPKEHFRGNTDENRQGIRLNSNQQITHDTIILKYLNENNATIGAAGCVFVMEAGLGKSFVGGKLMETIGLKTMLVVMNTDQLGQWRDKVFKKWYPNLRIGEFYGKAKKDGDIVIVVINSLCKMPNDYIKKFGLVVFDEIPEFMGPTRRNDFWNVGCRYMLGLTATPDERSDGMDIFYKQLVGPLVRAKDIEDFNVDDIVFKGNVHAIRYKGPKEYTERLTSSTGQMNCSLMNEQFSKDPYRNRLIVRCAKKLYDDGKQIFIFAQKRDHLTEWRKVLIEAGLPVEEDEDEKDNERKDLNKKVQTLMGQASEEQKARAKEHARIILTTYKFGSIGMSIIRMDAIIFATPQKSKMRQIIGRILRRGGDPSIVREIVDIIDQNTDIKKQYDKGQERDQNGKKVNRIEVYKEKKFTINEYEVNYDEVDTKELSL